MPLHPLLLLLQDVAPMAPTALGRGTSLVMLGFFVLVIASMWIVFAKAGEYGWACLIPIWSGIVMARVGGKPGWWGLLLLVPIINLIAWFVISFGIAERFGRSGAFGLGIALLPFIFFPIIAFSDDEASPQPA